MTDTTRSPNTDGPVARALTTVVRDHGTRIAEDPRRVQALLADVLGSDGQSMRSDVEAIVSAARHGVAAGLAEGRLDPGAAVARLEAEGVAPVMAQAAVDIWAAALSTPPVPTPSTVPAPIDETTVTAPDPAAAPAPIDGVAPMAAGDVPPAPLVVGPPEAPPTSLSPEIPVPPPPVPPSPAFTSAPTVTVSGEETRRRRVSPLIGLAGVGVVLLVVALVAVLLSTGDTDDEAGGPKDDPETVETVAELRFPEEKGELGTTARVWRVDDGSFGGTVTVTNSTEAAVSGQHIEVIPKSLADHVDKVTFDPEVSEVLEADPVVAWDVKDLAPGAKVTYRYTIDVDGDAGDEELANWRKEAADARTAYLEKIGAEPPTLEIHRPVDGTTHDGSEVDVAGRTDPGATVTVDGAPTTVNPDGTFVHRRSGLAVGANQITVVATGTNGVSTTEIVTLAYVPKAPPTPEQNPPPGDGGSKGVTCWDGSTAASQSKCPTKPSGGGSSVTCWNGTKAATQSQCPRDTRVTCWNGQKAATQSQCPPDTRVTCWNGQKAATQSQCPRDTRVTCWNGQKVASASQCPAEPTTTVARKPPTAVTGWVTHNLFRYVPGSGTYGGSVNLHSNAGGDYTHVELPSSLSGLGHADLVLINGVVYVYPHHVIDYDWLVYDVVDSVTGRRARGTIYFNVAP